MRLRPRHYCAVAFAAAAVGAGLLLGIEGWLEPHRPVEFCGLILAAILAAVLPMQQSGAEDRVPLSPSLIIHFTSLLLFGPDPTMLVAVAGIVARWFADSTGSHPLRRVLWDAVTIMAATQAAAFAHRALGGTLGHFVWPSQGVPIAAAVVAYCFVKSVSEEVIAPLVVRRPVNRAWAKSVLRKCP